MSKTSFLFRARHLAKLPHLPLLHRAQIWLFDDFFLTSSLRSSANCRVVASMSLFDRHYFGFYRSEIALAVSPLLTYSPILHSGVQPCSSSFHPKFHTSLVQSSFVPDCQTVSAFLFASSITFHPSVPKNRINKLVVT